MKSFSIISFAVMALAVTFAPVMISANELPTPVPQSLVKASDYLAAIRKTRGQDGPALAAALEMVDSALAEVEGGGSKTERRTAGKPRAVTGVRDVPTTQPSPGEMHERVRRSHLPTQRSDADARKIPKMTRDQAAEARALVARLKELIAKDPTADGVAAGLDELSGLLGR